MTGPSYDYIKKFIEYDPETGLFYSHWKRGRKATREHKHTGYLTISIGKFKTGAHRLAWFMTYREWPKALDHINRDKKDNRICNLRLATITQNAQNRSVRTRYLSKCIYLDDTGQHKRIKKYSVRVQANGKRHFIGRYKTEQEAKDAAVEAIKRLHGEFSAI